MFRLARCRPAAAAAGLTAFVVLASVGTAITVESSSAGPQQDPHSQALATGQPTGSFTNAPRGRPANTPPGYDATFNPQPVRARTFAPGPTR